MGSNSAAAPFPGAAALWTAPAPGPALCGGGGVVLFCFVLFGIQFMLASTPLSRNHFKMTQTWLPNCTMKKVSILWLWGGENPPDCVATLLPCPVVQTAAAHPPPSDSRKGQALALLKREKLAFVLLVTTRRSKRRQGLNRMGTLFRWLVSWKNGGLCTLRDCLTFHFKPVLFIQKNVGTGFGIQEKG